MVIGSRREGFDSNYRISGRNYHEFLIELGYDNILAKTHKTKKILLNAIVIFANICDNELWYILQ